MTNPVVPESSRVGAQPDRPVLVFDGDCGFCRFWIARWQQRTGDAVEYRPYQDPEIARRFPEIPPTQFARAVQLINVDGRVFGAAEAVFRLIAVRGGRVWLWAYAHLPGVAPLSERAYRAIANHRSLAGKLTKMFWGPTPERSTYARATWLFLRLLGCVYLLAFWSLGTQILALSGHDGILPADNYLATVRAMTGPERFWLLPTLAWVSASDAALRAWCVGGGALACLLIVGILPSVVLPVLWLFYLSLSLVGGDFLSYQWDALLLETGLLAIFLAPLTRRERLGALFAPPRLAVRLVLWLLFRVMVGSGAVKLFSGDATWHNLTALSFHFETQPIPTPLAWYAHWLPPWLLKGSTLALFVIEIGVPYLILASRRWRVLAFVLLVGLQSLIALTGNYAFFNLLAIALCLFLLDDATLGNWGTIGIPAGRAHQIRHAALVVVAIVTFPVSAYTFARVIGIELPPSAVVDPLARLIAPFRSVNGYGLFAVMTTTRPEIIIEGSEDGTSWVEYEFKYKAGDPRRRPPWVAPHQPRLDWQMWFAALGTFDSEPWFQNFCVRLLEADPHVLRLLERDPFEGRRPRQVRAVLYRYRFSDPATRRRDHVWWTRERIGDYSPPLSLSDVNSVSSSSFLVR